MLRNKLDMSDEMVYVRIKCLGLSLLMGIVSNTVSNYLLRHIHKITPGLGKRKRKKKRGGGLVGEGRNEVARVN